MNYIIKGPDLEKICRIDFSPEEWSSISRRKKQENRRNALSVLTAGLLGVFCALFGGMGGFWKWAVLSAGILLSADAVGMLFRNPTGLSDDGSAADQAGLDKFISQTLRSLYQKPGKPVEAARCDDGTDGEPVPFNKFLPPPTCRKFSNGYALDIPAGDVPLRAGRIVLFGVIMILTGLVLFAIWSSNIAGSFFRVVFTASGWLLGVLILTARPISRPGKIRFLIFCLFLAFLTGMQIYANRALPKYLEFVYQT